ncbi:hypothetical protein D3C87_2069370 [compost metagenome]
MLRPTKFSNPDKTVLAVSSLILERLGKTRIEKYEDLRMLVKSNQDGQDTLFLPSVNLLFLLGVVEYRTKSDSFEYVARK